MGLLGALAASRFLNAFLCTANRARAGRQALLIARFAGDLCCLVHRPVRIENEFLGHARIEVFVTLRRVLKLDHGCVHDLAIGKRSYRIACINAGLCFSTGVWPVEKR